MDMVIRMLKERIKSLSGNDSVENVKKDIDEIETINIELEHSVAKLISKNENLRNEREHLKSIYKDQFDSIKKTHEKVFAIAALKNELRKIKGKNVFDTAVSKPAATIAPGIFKLNLEPLAPKLLQNKDVHIDYIKHSRVHADILREIVKNARALSPLDSNLDSACNASGSKPSGNTKDNKISQASSSNKIKKVEDQSRSIKSRKNKKNHVDKPECNTDVIWKATGRTFTIVGNRCPLTRITSTKIVPPKESTIALVVTPTQGILVYSRRPKASRSVGSSTKVKNVESVGLFTE
ncbi:hypothetical protein Tco_1217696 [Tanacetum coccineum]